MGSIPFSLCLVLFGKKKNTFRKEKQAISGKKKKKKKSFLQKHPSNYGLLMLWKLGSIKDIKL